LWENWIPILWRILFNCSISSLRQLHPRQTHPNSIKLIIINLQIPQKNYVFQSNHNSLLLNIFSFLNIASSLNLVSNWHMCLSGQQNNTRGRQDNHNNAKQKDTTTSTKTMTLSVIVAFLHYFKSLKPKP
jgi:hypothetical protein